MFLFLVVIGRSFQPRNYQRADLKDLVSALVPTMGAQKATQKSSDLSKSPWGTLPHFVPTTRFAHIPMLISAISHNFQENSAVGNKVSNLLSRIDALEDCFDSPPSGVPEQGRRVDLIRYWAAILPLLPMLISS